MLEAAGIPLQPAYKPREVQVILNMDDRTFRMLCDIWEPNRKTRGIESYYVSTHRRVPHHALVEYLAFNNNYERNRSL